MARATHPHRNVKAIIEEQIRRWSLERDGRGKRRGKQAAVEPWPVITMSREFGSLGAEVARQLADKLGFSLWDQELVNAVAKRTGLRKALVASLDEHVRGRVDDFVATLFTSPDATAAEYVRQVGIVVHALENNGAAVIVGRGGQFVVRPDRALRVRIVCPYAERARGYAEREGLTPGEARKEVSRVERERLHFYRKHYGVDVTRAVHYDLVLNTCELSLLGARNVVVAAYRSKFGRLPRRGRT